MNTFFRYSNRGAVAVPQASPQPVMANGNSRRQSRQSHVSHVSQVSRKHSEATDRTEDSEDFDNTSPKSLNMTMEGVVNAAIKNKA